LNQESARSGSYTAPIDMETLALEVSNGQGTEEPVRVGSGPIGKRESFHAGEFYGGQPLEESVHG